MKEKQIPYKSNIEIEVNGEKVSGSWFTDKGCITVECYYGEKYYKNSTLLGGHSGTPEGLAKIMLREFFK